MLTGAGISLASGIPTFRGSDPGAIWASDIMELATYRFFASDPVASWQWYRRRFLGVLSARPNPAHRAVAAIDDHVRYLQKDGDGPEATIDDGLVAEPPRESRTLLYRIAQEALSNVRKHARAAHVWISLRSEAGGVRVSIRDDGSGFALERSGGGGVPGHVGIPSMRERAQLAGGWFRIDSEPGVGTAVTTRTSVNS